MAFRGRGRGRGFGGGGYGGAKQEPLELFPEDVNLPDAKVDEVDVNMKKLLNWNNKLQSYWKASPYLLEDTTLKKSQIIDVPRFSDKLKQKTTFTRDSLSQVLTLSNFPKELIQGTKRTSSQKKFRWNPESGIKSLDSLFDKLEKKDQVHMNEDEKDKKEGEDEDEEEDAENEEDDGDLSDDDYNQNEYFDDDEDDYNDVDDGPDEPTY
ncbi:hypothetical protein L6164_017314 [Bauhinia variegata]|uniref:Uncharacterized protein n=1 Tax=Bauhinia variegata TaxID=167791 RepID=A0ACB9N9G4_BAUVA|nr:hypothetical protein L6164_017314 [Bauhinia variegata]